MDPNAYIHQLYEFMEKAEILDRFGQQIAFNAGITEIIHMLKTQTSSGKKVILIGNGGSAAIAAHGALDFWKNGKMRAVSFNEGALLTCIGNDYGYSHVFEKPVEMFADPGDVLIAISSSGKSENIILGIEAAREKECRVVTLSGFSSQNPLRKAGDFNIYIPSGSYGFVELAHQIIIHMFVDLIIENTDKDA